jgi:hypothetical protein
MQQPRKGALPPTDGHVYHFAELDVQDCGVIAEIWDAEKVALRRFV